MKFRMIVDGLSDLCGFRRGSVAAAANWHVDNDRRPSVRFCARSWSLVPQKELRGVVLDVLVARRLVDGMVRDTIYMDVAVRLLREKDSLQSCLRLGVICTANELPGTHIHKIKRSRDDDLGST